VSLLFVFACKEKTANSDETILKGKATIYVDESVFPIIEDEEAVFETQYEARLHLVPKSEAEVVNSLLNDTAKIAVLTRELSDKEIKAFHSKKIFPKTTPFATDAIAFVRNKSVNDTLISLQDVIDFMKGKEISSVKGLVFDNANSSIAHQISAMAGVTISNQKNIFSFNTNSEVIKYVAENKGMVGVIGMNWIFQPPLEMQEQVEKLSVLSVKGINRKNFVYPSQDNLAMGEYPLARHLYIVNCQGYSGLGMGFASFLGGERGQRIILKSGLVPERIPTRKIVIKNSSTKDKK
jgi:phosphate transport system substrate-binding protein